jgi:catechol 2,3-dioxygenase-like lactoylglutathione lyase family enzyme
VEVDVDQRITLITLGVEDLERAIRFYRDGLGWVPSASSQEGEIAFFQLNGMVLALWPRTLLARDARVSDAGGWGGVALAQNHGSREAVDDAVATAIGAGATLLKAPEETEWGGYSGYVADPDGHAWEIAHNPYWPLAEDRSLVLPG